MPARAIGRYVPEICTRSTRDRARQALGLHEVSGKHAEPQRATAFTFAIAVPFTARLMAYLDYPYADDYASFIPGILFVVVLLLAFVGMMGGNFQFFVTDASTRSEVGYFAEGALFWKFLKDGCLIAFYPVFGEVIFFYLQYQDLKREDDAIEDELAAAALAAEEASAGAGTEAPVAVE